MSSLKFSDLRNANIERLPLFKNGRGELAHPKPDGSDWSLGEWICGITGELGEAANLVKKLRRGDYTDEQFKAIRAELADEFADVACYLDIAAYQLRIDLGAAIASKFNRVSDRIGVDVKLPED